MGVAVAWKRYKIAIVLSLLTFVTLQFVPTFKSMVRDEDKLEEDVESRKEESSECR